MTRPKITLALTHYNRFHLLKESIRQVLDEPRISEIVISDDCSTDGSYDRILSYYAGRSSVKVHRNDRNLDCYFNKRQAVSLATNAWVILFDSDNVITPTYVDTLLALPFWDDWVAYCPVWAMPHFDYRRFSGKVVGKSNISQFRRDRMFTTALNTANYFFHRDNWLKVWDGTKNPHTADSIFQNYNWLKAGGSIHFVPGLVYEHRVHADSHYKNNWRKTGRFAQQVEQWLQLLR